MPVSQLVDDTQFCCTNRRLYGLTYLLNKQGSNITLDTTLDITLGIILDITLDKLSI